MQVYVAQNCGFCRGVRRAVDTALSVPPENTFVLGELIHNEDVVKKIEARGIPTVTSLEEVPAGANLLIRSHGVGKGVFAACREKGIRVIDCTCSFVARTQRIVAAAHAAGKLVAIAGHKDHPEVEGLVGWCEGCARVIGSEDEDLSCFADKNVVLVSQTTFSEQRFCKIVQNLQKVGPKTVEIFKTICYTTICRQREAERLSELCDAVLVIGGANSSNTEKLCEIASAHGKRVIRLVSAADFDYREIKNFERVGVIAGASTPDWQTQEVLCKMEENNAEVQAAEEVAEETQAAAEVAEEVKPEEPAAAPAAEPAEQAEAAEAPAPEPVAETAEAPASEPAEPVEAAEESAPEPAQETVEAPASEPVPVKEQSPMEKALAEMDGSKRYRKNQAIKVTIVSATDEGIIVSGSEKTDIAIAKEDLDCEEFVRADYAKRVGEEIEVIVVETTPKVRLSEKQIRKLKEEEALLAEIEGGKEFSVVCTGFNKGGLTAELGTYPVFIPAREIRSGYVKELDKYVGKKLRLKVQKPEDIRRTGRKEIIASQRAIIEAERAEKEAQRAAREAAFFESIHVDDVVEGKVERVTSFGAFVSVNGFDCLAHISDLSWTGVKQVTDVLEIGKRYEFKVLKVDLNNKKVSIGYKQLQPQPWDLAAEKYAEGDVVHGKVVRIVPFGAFVELEKGIDGLVHISQITHEWLENPTSALTIGEEVDAQIIKFDPENRRITLSIKALQPRPEYEPREPRHEKEEGGKQSRRKGGRRNAEPAEDEEYREWKDEGFSGASISELLGNDEDK